jgi:hypothetical protein
MVGDHMGILGAVVYFKSFFLKAKPKKRVRDEGDE